MHQPKELAAVDLEILKEKMASTIERVKADDPRTLRQKISQLEKHLRTGPAETKTVEVADLKAIERVVRHTEQRFEKAIKDRETVITLFARELNDLAQRFSKSASLKSPTVTNEEAWDYTSPSSAQSVHRFNPHPATPWNHLQTAPEISGFAQAP